MDPAEFAVLARQLVNGDLSEPRDGRTASEEARIRTACGRAYYALFLSVRAQIALRHGVLPRRVAHGALYTYLQSASVAADVRRLGRELERLYALRQKADYETSPPPDLEKVLRNPAYVDWLATQALDRMALLDQMDFSPILHRF